MWHEARKQERRIRGMIVDYRKRAERRQDFYERIQADPTQFIQVHGRRCKIHLDPAVAAAGDGAAIIVPWQGHQDNLIDRFDVRAHLDHIPPLVRPSDSDVAEVTSEERQCNYERYRILAQNDFLNVSEEKFLHQLCLEEQFGANAQLEAERNLGKKKQQKAVGATIGYSYDEAESSMGPQPFSHLMNVALQSSVPPSVGGAKSEKGSDSDSESDIDMDVAIEVSKLDTAQAHELNGCGRNYGMLSNDFYSFLTKDADEAEAMRMAREEEQEKMLLSGRKSRRERRAQKERRIACRPFSPPSYAAKEDTAVIGKKGNAEESDSRSPSPADINTGKITYITSFGGEDELQPHSKISININKGASQTATLGAACEGIRGAAGHATYAQKVKDNLEKLKEQNETFTSRGRARTRSRSQSHRRKSFSRTPTRSRSRDRRARREFRRERHSRSSSHERIKHRRRRSRSRQRSPLRRRRYSYSSSSSSSTSTNSSFRSRRRDKSKKSRKFKHGPTSDYRSRSRTPSRSRTCARPPTKSANVVPMRESIKQACDVEKTTKVEQTATNVPMISYPMPLRAMAIDVSGPPPPPPLAKVLATTAITPTVKAAPPPPLKRYYGRKRGDDTSSSSASDTEESDVEQQDTTKQSKSGTGEGNEDTDERIDMDTTSERSNPLPPISTSTSAGTSQTGKYSATPANNPSFSNASETKGGTSSGTGTGATTSTRMNLRERLKRKMQNLLNKQYKADKRAEIEKTERERQLQQERDDEMRELALKLRRRQRELRHKYGTPNSSKASDSEGSDVVAAADPNKPRRSTSRSSERPSTVTGSPSAELKKCQASGESSTTRKTTHTQSRRSHSRDYERDRKRSRSRSRSRSYFKSTHHRRSRSRSRGRRSASRRRHRSPSRTKRMRDPSHERTATRYAAERTRYDERKRRSRSHNERHSYRDRADRERERHRDWQRDREHDRNRERDRDRDRERDKDRDRNRDNRTVTSSSSSTATARGSRNRIVISAPPKLKKLVDY